MSSVELHLRLVTYQPGTFKENSRQVLWRTQEWYFVNLLLDLFGFRYKFYSDTFEGIIKRILRSDLSERSRKRIVGIFKSMVNVKSGEVNTSKGDRKNECLELIENI